MKKKILMMLLVALSVGTTGCRNSNKGTEQEETSVNTEAETENQETASPLEPTMSDGIPQILNTAEPVDEKGILSYISNAEIETELMQEISIFKNQLLSCSYSYDSSLNADILHLKLLSLDNGELLFETEIQTGGSYSVKIQVCGDRIAVSDAQKGIIHVLNDQLEETEQYELTGGIIYVNTALTEAYYFSEDGCGLYVHDLNSKKEKVLLDNIRNLIVYYYVDDYISMNYVDLSTADKRECYAGLNLETGEIEKLEIDSSFAGMVYKDGIWASRLLFSENTCLFGTQQEPYKFTWETAYPTLVLGGDPTKLMISTIESDGSQKSTVYGMDGTFLSSCVFEATNGTPWTAPIWVDAAEGYFMIMIDADGYDKLYFWDLSKETEGTDLELIPYYSEEEIGGVVLEQEYYDRAAAISEKYGITLKIGDQCDTDYFDKTAVQECDPVKVGVGLDMVEKALSNYPDGFFEQLRYGAFRTIEIALMGPISEKEEIEGHSSSAFVEAVNGRICMVLDLSHDDWLLEQNFYHETSHIIDKVLEHDALYRDDALYSEEGWWELNLQEFTELNPENGGYYGSYGIMPMEYFQEAFTAYFISDYGKSFSTEDRATVFETAMMGNYLRFSSETSLPLYEKLEYYCKCIRDCFDTTGWPEYTVWEETLRKAEQDI